VRECSAGFSAQIAGTPPVARSAWFNSTMVRRLIAAAVFPKPYELAIVRWLFVSAMSEKVVGRVVGRQRAYSDWLSRIARTWMGTESTPGMPPCAAPSSPLRLPLSPLPRPYWRLLPSSIDRSRRSIEGFKFISGTQAGGGKPPADR
jgi:hypothetical protein